MPETMRAVVAREFGGPEVLEVQDVPTPEPRPDEVLVRVEATSINRVDLKLRQDGGWAGIEPPAVLGYDVSGVVEEVGAAVGEFQPGDEVFYTPEIFGGQGSYAEYHAARADIVEFKPSNLSHVEAAALPLAGGTAWDALVTRAEVGPGEDVLVHGGGGGVGHLAVQIAKAAGAYVFTTLGEYDIGWVGDLGADEPIDYRAEDFREVVDHATGGTGVDLAFDTVGGDTLAQSVEVTAPYGRLVSIVGTTGDLDPAHLRNHTVHFLFLERERYKLAALRRLAEMGKLEPVVDQVVGLEEVPKAHERLAQGRVKGKIVVEI